MVALNTVLLVGLVISCVLLFVEFAQIESLTNLFADSLASGAWVNLGANLAFDLLFISLLFASLKLGYKAGIFSALCGLVIFGLVIGSGYLSFHLAFQTEMYDNIAVQMAFGSFGEAISSITSVTSNFGVSAERIAKIVLMAGTFIVLLIVVIIVGIFLPKLIDKLREGKAFNTVDGILGAVVLTVIVFGLLLVTFGILSTLSDLEIMTVFNSYMGNNYIANSLYLNNPLAGLGVFDGLPIRGWFGSSTVAE